MSSVLIGLDSKPESAFDIEVEEVSIPMPALEADVDTGAEAERGPQIEAGALPGLMAELKLEADAGSEAKRGPLLWSTAPSGRGPEASVDVEAEGDPGALLVPDPDAMFWVSDLSSALSPKDQSWPA